MRKRLLLFSAILSMAAMAAAQVPVKTTYDWPAVTTTAQVGKYITQIGDGIISGSSNFSIDWSVTGTAPSACTLRVEGSSDGVAWTGLDATAPAADSAPCTSSNLISIAQKPVRYVRVYIVTYTAGDSTTQVIFHYTRGSM